LLLGFFSLLLAFSEPLQLAFVLPLASVPLLLVFFSRVLEAFLLLVYVDVRLLVYVALPLFFVLLQQLACDPLLHEAFLSHVTDLLRDAFHPLYDAYLPRDVFRMHDVSLPLVELFLQLFELPAEIVIKSGL
jgi:hypothetical protein